MHPDIGTGHPDAQNAVAVDLEGAALPERPYLDPDSVVDLAADHEDTNTDGAADLAVMCVVAGLAIEHPASRLLDDDR